MKHPSKNPELKITPRMKNYLKCPNISKAIIISSHMNDSSFNLPKNKSRNQEQYVENIKNSTENLEDSIDELAEGPINTIRNFNLREKISECYIYPETSFTKSPETDTIVNNTQIPTIENETFVCTEESKAYNKANIPNLFFVTKKKSPMYLENLFDRPKQSVKTNDESIDNYQSSVRNRIEI